jgi:tetratricopeptide (TPR) repeat protein
MPRIRTIFTILKNQVFHVAIAAVCVGAALTAAVVLINWKSGEAREKNELRRAFEAGDYGEVCEKSLAALQEKPMDSFLLSTNGYASYQMALSRIDGESARAYIDQAIWSLRRALLKKPSRPGHIYYVLGKAYYAKSADDADLAVKYLEAAKAAGVTARDLDEYLGLAYASLKDYRNSIAAYSRLLGVSDTVSAPLLVRIAESYMGLEDWDNARAYLTRCRENARDAGVELKAALMLGRVLRNSGDTAGAEAAFNSVLESGENAEAAYELGELYTALGETTRARAAYRRAYRADPAFAPAQARLNTM